MAPSERTPEQRDHRFARARFVTHTILLGSLTTAVLFVGYASNLAHSTSAATPAPIVATTPSTTVPAAKLPAATSNNADGFEADDSSFNATPSTGRTTPTSVTKTAPATAYTPPTTAPVTTPTVCSTTPSGRMICH